MSQSPESQGFRPPLAPPTSEQLPAPGMPDPLVAEKERTIEEILADRDAVRKTHVEEIKAEPTEASFNDRLLDDNPAGNLRFEIAKLAREEALGAKIDQEELTAKRDFLKYLEDRPVTDMRNIYEESMPNSPDYSEVSIAELTSMISDAKLRTDEKDFGKDGTTFDSSRTEVQDLLEALAQKLVDKHSTNGLDIERLSKSVETLDKIGLGKNPKDRSPLNLTDQERESLDLSVIEALKNQTVKKVGKIATGSSATVNPIPFAPPDDNDGWGPTDRSPWIEATDGRSDADRFTSLKDPIDIIDVSDAPVDFIAKSGSLEGYYEALNDAAASYGKILDRLGFTGDEKLSRIDKFFAGQEERKNQQIEAIDAKYQDIMHKIGQVLRSDNLDKIDNLFDEARPAILSFMRKQGMTAEAAQAEVDSAIEQLGQQKINRLARITPRDSQRLTTDAVVDAATPTTPDAVKPKKGWLREGVKGYVRGLGKDLKDAGSLPKKVRSLVSEPSLRKVRNAEPLQPQQEVKTSEQIAFEEAREARKELLNRMTNNSLRIEAVAAKKSVEALIYGGESTQEDFYVKLDMLRLFKEVILSKIPETDPKKVGLEEYFNKDIATLLVSRLEADSEE